MHPARCPVAGPCGDQGVRRHGPRRGPRPSRRGLHHGAVRGPGHTEIRVGLRSGSGTPLGDGWRVPARTGCRLHARRCDTRSRGAGHPDSARGPSDGRRPPVGARASAPPACLPLGPRDALLQRGRLAREDLLEPRRPDHRHLAGGAAKPAADRDGPPQLRDLGAPPRSGIVMTTAIAAIAGRASNYLMMLRSGVRRAPTLLCACNPRFARASEAQVRISFAVSSTTRSRCVPPLNRLPEIDASHVASEIARRRPRAEGFTYRKS